MLVSLHQKRKIVISQLQQCLTAFTAQAVGSVSDRAAVDIAKGLKPVSDFANDVADEISAPGGAIDRIVKKQAEQVDRATKVVQKADIF